MLRIDTGNLYRQKIKINVIRNFFCYICQSIEQHSSYYTISLKLSVSKPISSNLAYIFVAIYELQIAIFFRETKLQII